MTFICLLATAPILSADAFRRFYLLRSSLSSLRIHHASAQTGSVDSVFTDGLHIGSGGCSY